MDELDDTDLLLLKTLQQNGKYTIKELAAMVNLSTTPVFERVKRLEQDGYIKKYIAVLDAEKLNSGFVVFVNVKLRQHNKNIGHDFVSEIMVMDEVVECYNISGDFDFMLKVQVPDMKHYQDFVFNKLGSVESIGSTYSSFVMAEIKKSLGINLSKL